MVALLALGTTNCGTDASPKSDKQTSKKQMKIAKSMEYAAVEKFGKWERANNEILTGIFEENFGNNGKVVLMNLYDANGELQLVRKPIFENNRQTGEIKYNSQGVEIQRVEVKEWDKNNMPTLKVAYDDKKQEVLRFEEKYTDTLIVESRATYPQEVGTENHWFYSYDDKGNMTEFTIKSKSNNEKPTISIYKVKYLDFDQYGNWTKRLEVDEAKATKEPRIRERTIDYY